MGFSVFVPQGYPLNPSYRGMLGSVPQSGHVNGRLLKTGEGSGCLFPFLALSVNNSGNTLIIQHVWGEI